MQSATRPSLSHPAVIAWALLMLATAVSWWLGGNHSLGGDKRYAIAAIAVVAFVKVHLVGRYFMELRHAPMLLRFCFDTWTVLTCAAIIVLYCSA